MSFVSSAVSVSQLITSIWLETPFFIPNFDNFLGNGQLGWGCVTKNLLLKFPNNRATFLHLPSPASPIHMSIINIFCEFHHFFNLQNINLFIIKSRTRVAWLRRVCRCMTQKVSFIIFQRKRRIFVSDSVSQFVAVKY